MLNKTTGSAFLKYGKSSSVFKNKKDLACFHKTVSGHGFTSLTSYSTHCYIEASIESMAAVAIQNTHHEIELFVLHDSIRINKNIPFVIFPLGQSLIYSIYVPQNANATIHNLYKPFVYDTIKPKLMVSEIYAYYYNVKSPDYHFKGETHSHFELTFVDNGSLLTSADANQFLLNSYDLLFYGPNQFHDQRVEGNKPCSYLTVIFDLMSEDCPVLLNRIFNCSRNEYRVLNNFIQASSSNTTYGKDFMINYLQELILLLLQGGESKKAANPIQQHFESELVEEITSFIRDNLYQVITVENICTKFSVSRSTLQQLFKNNLNVAPKKYINDLKLEKSKLLIKEGKSTISEISSLLGFSSIHYFSRKFTQTYQITPSDYAKKIYHEYQ
ncbi:MAG: helix-turn-helix domain-containing protein [Anaerorhabdus sp.]